MQKQHIAGLIATLIAFAGDAAAGQLTSMQLSYPPKALKAGEEGTVRFEVNLSKKGVVTKCRVTQSSGHDDLDRQTCLQLRKTGHFKIAMDESGSPVASTYAGRLRRVIPRPAPEPTASSPAG